MYLRSSPMSSVGDAGCASKWCVIRDASQPETAKGSAMMNRACSVNVHTA